jgi:phage shock protein A
VAFIHDVRTLVVGTVNDLLQKEIDLNSPVMLRQYVRDLEDALGHMKLQGATQAGAVLTAKRVKKETERDVALLEKTIGNLMAQSHEELARPKAEQLVRLREKFAKCDEDIKSAEEASNNIDLTVSRIEAKHAEMVDRVHELERLDHDTKAKQESAKAISQFSKALNSSNSPNIDALESRMRQQNDVAQAQFQRALGDVHIEEDPALTADVNDVLAHFRPKAAEAKQ